MPFPRRSRLTGILTLLAIIAIIYIRTGDKQTRSSSFYIRTSEALDRAASAKEYEAHYADPVRNTEISDRLNRAEKDAKRAAEAKGAKFFGDKSKDDIMVEAGRKDGSDQKVMRNGRDTISNGDSGKDGVGEGEDADLSAEATDVVDNERSTAKTEKDYEVDMELNTILKRSPIIIFSKSYCPHSRAAKEILLEKYKITPAPYVVELNEHPLGPSLQAAIAGSTGRKTVPNILINGKSIGGGDEVKQLHADARLVDIVKSMGGKRIMEARPVKSNLKR